MRTFPMSPLSCKKEAHPFDQPSICENLFQFSCEERPVADGTGSVMDQATYENHLDEIRAKLQKSISSPLTSADLIQKIKPFLTAD